MNILLQDLGKRYQRYWVFRGITHDFSSGSRTAILGQNGSGKSTLLRIMAGMQPPSAGKISWAQGVDKKIAQPVVFSSISFCAPGMELPEELTLEETLQFHFAFKKPLNGFDISTIIEAIGMKAAAKKPVGDYSSGMKQRVKLAQAIFSDTSLLLLDEPCTNLDEAGVSQYQDWIGRYAGNRTVIVASNDPREYRFCQEELLMRNYQ
jgi:ABC-type multidrug transport system ATPase subunit